MSVLTRQRCFTHPLREAAARCPSCTRFFCRECVTEHEGRVVCAACLRDELAATAARHTARRRVWWIIPAARRTVQFACGIGLTWFFFHLLGQTLLSLPDQFHEGTLWEAVDKLQGGNP